MSASTIAALATAPGRGGVAVIRVSGPEAFAIAERLTGWKIAETRSERGSDVHVASVESTSKHLAGREASAPQIRLCRVYDPVGADPRAAREGERRETRDKRPEDARRETRDADANQTIKQSNNQTILDTALVLAFRGPHSYTGEDVVEFQCHGGSVTPARVLAACFAAGAAAARRGEFTERAFLNGKIDLSEAESVIELVDAKTARAADDALARQAGVRKAAYRALYETALALSAELEHALDVDEEELPPDFLPARAARAAALGGEARRLAGSADAGRLLREGALVVLAGAPNAGKSSLLNALCGEDRAIVSPTPGTTRDTIEAWIDLDGWPVRLVDTAGLRETGDAIEAEGVRRAEALLAKADVILALDCEIAAAHFGEMRPRVLRLHAKCDLDSSEEARCLPYAGAASCRTTGEATSTSLQAEPTGARQQEPTRVRQQGLRVSAKTGEGLAALRAAIAARLAARAGAAAEDGATASERERALLLAAARRLEDADEDARRETRDASQSNNPTLQHSNNSPDPVLLANAVRSAAAPLGQLIGATYSSDLLEALFSRFCVGK